MDEELVIRSYILGGQQRWRAENPMSGGINFVTSVACELICLSFE